MKCIPKLLWLLVLTNFISYGATNSANSLVVFPYGTFVPKEYMRTDDNRVYSENGRYYCEFEISLNELNRREVSKMEFYENGKLLYERSAIPGDDFAVSNSGYMVVYDLQHKEGGDLTIRVFAKDGSKVLKKVLQGASLFGFSQSGNKYGVGSRGKFEVFNLPKNKVQKFPRTSQFAISKDDALIAIARDDGISVYSEKGLLGTITEKVTVNYVRKIKFSEDNSTVAFIGKRKLAVYNVNDFSKKFVDLVSGYSSYADLAIEGSNIHTGIHLRNEETKMSHGIIRTYDLAGTRAVVERECAKSSYMSKTPGETFDHEKAKKKGEYSIPWPFEPQNEPKLVWNGYLQCVGSSTGVSGAYLHQGTDLDVSTRDRCVAVEAGTCKCNLTMGGDLYWRIAVCTVNVAERSNGWLYAHLVRSTITKQPGDKVAKGEFLATIVRWSSANLVNNAHLHFSHISDVGIRWELNDNNQWDNEVNPLTYLRPSDDTKPPQILKFSNSQKFGISTNDNNSPRFITTKEISGKVDLYAHISDEVGKSPWDQPAHSLFYSLRWLDKNRMVINRKVGCVRNGRVKGYSTGGNYKKYVPAYYHVSRQFPGMGWSDRDRHHLQVITNSDGDTSLTLEHQRNALNTALYNDGNYRIYVEAVDAALNSSIDSMDVVFNNGINGIKINGTKTITDFVVNSIIPMANTFQVSYSVPFASKIQLTLYDATGAKLSTLVSEGVSKGKHTVTVNKMISQGMYFIKLQANAFTLNKKFVVLK